jgi:hypothetical protein
LLQPVVLVGIVLLCAGLCCLLLLKRLRVKILQLLLLLYSVWA